MPPTYFERGGRSPELKKSKKPKTIIREIIEPVYFDELAAHDEKRMVSKDSKKK